ncbi:MAG: hypothetical protein J6Y36_09505, partial [Treponema sp.]|nr:hypothetical protein [Treponema sp.]
IQYVSRISQNKKKGMSAVAAVDEAMNWAIHEKLLDGFFKVQKEEVLAMSLTEYDEEEVRRDFIEEGREIGIAEGITRGSQQKAIEAAKSFYANGVSVDIIAKSLNMTVDNVMEIVNP